MVSGIPLPYPPLIADTPPMTPELGEPPQIYRETIPDTPRTPRKPKHPRHAALPSERANSTLLRFELQAPNPLETPTLKIHVTNRQRTFTKARRRLWSREYEPLEFLDLDPPPPKRLQSQQQNGTTAKKASDHYSDSTDADDEMEGGSHMHRQYERFVLSPPHSPPARAPAHPPAVSSRLTHTHAHSHAHGRDHESGKTSKEQTKAVKTCASCKTKKTPLWRDSEDGTPYCNACGIRYKKYRIRCSICLYIPRKDEKIISGNSCWICGSRLVHCRVSGR